MQRIYPCEQTVEQYIESGVASTGDRGGVCPICGTAGGLWRHGVRTGRDDWAAGHVAMILVARFWCRGCRADDELPAGVCVELPAGERGDVRGVSRWRLRPAATCSGGRSC